MLKKWFILGLSLCATLAFSQASLKISVVNALTGQPVKSWSVQLNNASIGYSQSFQTNNFGQAEVSGLSTTGSYTVSIPETNLYYGFVSDPIRLRSNQSASLLLSIISKANQKLDAVEVTGAKTSTVNTVNAEVSAELPAKEIQEIPTEGRDITRILYRLPNVTRSTGFYPEAPNVSINGANALFTSYLIDGMDNNERFLGGQRFAIPVGMVQNITVLANT
jgi:hypothetical protein